MKNRISILAVSALLTLVTLAAQTPAQTPAPPPAAQTPANPDPWISVRFLMGTWESKTTGGVAQAQASAGYAFRLELRDHILVRHTRSGVCNAPDDFDCQHSDLLYIYPGGSGGGLQAIYFDNEGHIIHYEVGTPAPNAVVFVSDPAQPGPQYRLSYTLLQGVLSGKFELKLPGQGDFTSYLEWSGHKR